MKICIVALLLIVAYAGSSATSEAQAQDQHPDTVLHPSVKLPDELARILRDYEREWEAGNAEAVAELFSPDGFALPSSRPPFRCRESIAGAYARAGGKLSLRALHYRTEKDIGFIIGTYSYNPREGDSGKFVLALERASNGRWLIAADIDNGITSQ